MSTWTEDAVPVRRSSRRLSVNAADVQSISSSTPSSISTPAKEGQRMLMHPKSSKIPRLKQIDEKMASSDDEIIFVPDTEPKRGRGRPRKNSPARPKMTAIKTPASSVAAVKDAAASAAPSVKKDKTPPRSRSSSRTRRGVVTPPISPTKSAAGAAALPKIPPVINFDDSPIVTRRSTRLASSKTAATNGHANGSSVHEAAAPKNTPAVARFQTKVWADQFADKHPFLTKIMIPGMICLAYALVIIGLCAYFDIHKKAPQWMDQVARNINDMYDDFMARRAAASAASAANEEI